MTDSIEIIRSLNPNLAKSEELGMSSADSLQLANNSIQDSSSLDNILANSQQYEVMYLGKLPLAQKRALPSFIDEIVDNWKEQAKIARQTDMKDDSNDKKNNKDSIKIPIVSVDDNKIITNDDQITDKAAGENSQSLDTTGNSQTNENNKDSLRLCDHN
jgi:hypothetical protein